MFKIDTAGENIVYTDTDLNVKFCIPANDCSGMKYTQEISSLNEKEDIKKLKEYYIINKEGNGEKF